MLLCFHDETARTLGLRHFESKTTLLTRDDGSLSPGFVVVSNLHRKLSERNQCANWTSQPDEAG
jgi:hypothetical protein